MKKKIVVIGSSNIDFIMKMPRLPRIGETITDSEYMQTFGGKGANQAVGAARAGGNVFFISCVGDDDITPRMLKQYKKDGINIDFVFREKNISSGTALVMIGEKGTNYLAVAPGANYKLSPQYIDKSIKLIKEAEIILLQYEIPVETLKYILDICDQYHKTVLWNFAPAREFDKSYLSKVSTLIVNETEAEILSGITVNNKESIIKASEKLVGMGCISVIITLGDKGSFINSQEGKMMVPSFKVNAVDTTAAGDIYCGTLAVALTEGRSLKDAVEFAGAAAAISVTRLGAQPSAPYREEIDEFMRGE